MTYKGGFTLIELIIVIAIVALVSAAVFVSIDPGRRLGDAKDAVRATGSVAIEKAIEKAIVENAAIPVNLAALTVDTPYMIVIEGGDDTGTVQCATLDQEISRANVVSDFKDFLGQIPVDSEATGDDTGYYITRKVNSFYVDPCNAYGDTYIAMASLPQDDDFSGTFNSSLWTYSEQEAENNYSQSGGILTISGPGVGNNDLWDSELPAMVRQEVSDSDFSLTINVNTELATDNHVGLIAYQDDANYVALALTEFNAGENHLLIYSTIDAVSVPEPLVIVSVEPDAPYYLRLIRRNDVYIGYYSTDTINWENTFALSNTITVNEVGVFAGEFGASTAFSIDIDDFDYQAPGSVTPGLPITDLFNDSFNSSLWTYYETDASCNYSQSGGTLTLYGPSAGNHDLWQADFDTPMIRQSVDNGDFTIQTLVNTETPDKNIVGLIAYQDDANYIALAMNGTYSPNNTLAFYDTTAASSTLVQTPQFKTAASPFYLRLVRSGDDFRGYYSADGATWEATNILNKSITINEVGILAGEYDTNSFSLEFEHFTGIEY